MLKKVKLKLILILIKSKYLSFYLIIKNIIILIYYIYFKLFIISLIKTK
jgi:hypothetical protein